MKWIVSVLLCVLSAMSFAETRVYILAGQSNMQGQYQQYTLPSNVTYYDKSTNYGTVGRSGIESGIAEKLSLQYPTDAILLIKYAVGGSSLHGWVIRAMTTEGRISNNSGEHWNVMVNTVRAAMGNDTIDGIFWMQGETDAYEFRRSVVGAEGLYKQYKYNLIKLVHDFRSEFGNVPVVVGRIHDYTTQEQLDQNISYTNLILSEAFIQVRKAQTDVSGIKVVSTDTFDLIDRWHFSQESSVQLGECMVDSLVLLAKYNGCGEDYSEDDYSESDFDMEYLYSLYETRQNRRPDYEGLTYWVKQLHVNYNDSINLLNNGLTYTDMGNSCKDKGGTPINGNCHFGWSCVTQSQAQTAMNNSQYVLCPGQVPTVNDDCKDYFGTAMAYVASCPLVNPAEGKTVDKNVHNLYSTYLKRRPDQEGYNFWLGNESVLESGLINLIQQQESY